MHIGGPAKYFFELDDINQLDELAGFISDNSLDHYILGEGSNTIFSDSGFDGIVVQNRLKTFELIKESGTSASIKVGAGENWDEVVARTVDMGLSGIEALSAIPGTVGATPVQNVGAYGQEIADVLLELEAYDLEKNKLTMLSAAECQFSYRDSIFKSSAKNRYIITSITLELKKSQLKPPFYTSLQKYLDANNIHDHSPASIRKTVIEVRKSKLPDPSVIANSGSFFKNPILNEAEFGDFQSNHPNAPHFQTEKGIKIPAGWLIEAAGMKGKSSGHFSTYNLNSLVITNDGHGSYQELMDLVQQIQSTIKSKFNIDIEPEPNLL